MPKVTIDEEIVKTRTFKIELTEDEVEKICDLLHPAPYVGPETAWVETMREILSDDKTLDDDLRKGTQEFYEFWHDVSEKLAATL